MKTWEIIWLAIACTIAGYFIGYCVAYFKHTEG